jgi:hypothetical protein
VRLGDIGFQPDGLAVLRDGPREVNERNVSKRMSARFIASPPVESTTDADVRISATLTFDILFVTGYFPRDLN